MHYVRTVFIIIPVVFGIMNIMIFMYYNQAGICTLFVHSVMIFEGSRGAWVRVLNQFLLQV